MRSTLYIFSLTLFFAVQGLKCRLEQDERSQEEFDNIVHSCVKQNDFQQQNNYSSNKNNKGRNENNNRNNHQNNQHQSDGKRQSSYDKEENDDDADYDYDSENKSNNGKGGNNWKSQKGRYPQNNKYLSNQNPGNRESYNQQQGTTNDSKNIGSPLEGVEPCIIHCIFKQKRMLNNRNYIDKSNTIHVLTHKVRNSELKEFIEDSINECLDVLHNGNSEGKCEESKHFALCLEEKGKHNCEDWGTENHRNSNKNTNTNKVYYMGNERLDSYNENNQNKPISGGSYGNRGRGDQNKYSLNDRQYSDDRRNNGYNYNENSRESQKNRMRNEKDEDSKNTGQSNQNDEQINLQNYFQNRGRTRNSQKNQ